MLFRALVWTAAVGWVGEDRRPETRLQPSCRQQLNKDKDEPVLYDGVQLALELRLWDKMRLMM